MKNNIWQAALLLLYINPLSAFFAPSEKILQTVPFERIDKAFSLRNIQQPDTELLHTLINRETTGFLGYHGASLDFMIYQDIIKSILQEVMEIEIREDFHFLAPPFDPAQKIQTKNELSSVLTSDQWQEKLLKESTIPLSFTLFSNYNRFGHACLEHYSKNISVHSLGYQRRLRWFFQQLGIDESKIPPLFENAQDILKSEKGVLLQMFDQSKTPYTFAKEIAYPATPSGYLARNVTVDEYFEDDAFLPPYPHEVRLIISTHKTLNPKSPLKIIRYHEEISDETVQEYLRELKQQIKQLQISEEKKRSFRKQLLDHWKFS